MPTPAHTLRSPPHATAVPHLVSRLRHLAQACASVVDNNAHAAAPRIHLHLKLQRHQTHASNINVGTGYRTSSTAASRLLRTLFPAAPTSHDTTKCRHMLLTGICLRACPTSLSSIHGSSLPLTRVARSSSSAALRLFEGLKLGYLQQRHVMRRSGGSVQQRRVEACYGWLELG